MKTFLVQLQESVGIQYTLRDILIRLTDEEVITEINLFAKNVATEALKFNDDYGRLTEILPDTITDENNIPKL